MVNQKIISRYIYLYYFTSCMYHFISIVYIVYNFPNKLYLSASRLNQLLLPREQNEKQSMEPLRNKAGGTLTAQAYNVEPQTSKL